MNPRPLRLLLLAALLGAHPAAAQPADGARASLTVRTNPDSARVLLDGADHGFAPLTVDTLLPGGHLLRVVPRDIGDWLAESVEDSLTLAPGESRALDIALPRRMLLNSSPSGARVFLGDSLAGVTPLLLRAGLAPAEAVLLFEKEGFEPVRLPLSTLPPAGTIVPLARREGTPAEDPMISGAPPLHGPRTVRLVAAGGAILLAGASGMYFQQQANDVRGELAVTADPGRAAYLRRQRDIATVSMIVTELALGIIAYVLLAD